MAEEDLLKRGIAKNLRIMAVLLFLVLVFYGISYTVFGGRVPAQLMTAIWLLVVTVLTFGGVRLLEHAVNYYLNKKGDQNSYTEFLQTFKNLIKIFIYLTAIGLALGVLGIEITPLVASLGIGGLAVALALQSTLANYFSGLYLTASRAIKVGDYIELEDGLKGYVHEIGWRATKIRMLPNNIVLVPNSKLADSTLINYHMPDQEMSVVIQCGVDYSSDLEKVEQVTIEAAKKVLQTVEGGKKDFEPFIRYHTFGDSNIQFSIILRVEEFVNQYLVTHEFFKELTKKYREEGIEISWPIRKVFNYPVE